MADSLDRKPPSQLQRELSVILAPRHGLLACAAISAALLTGAFLFEHVGGMAPCSLCIWQRWAHAAVILAAMTGLLMLPSRAPFFCRRRPRWQASALPAITPASNGSCGKALPDARPILPRALAPPTLSISFSRHRWYDATTCHGPVRAVDGRVERVAKPRYRGGSASGFHFWRTSGETDMTELSRPVAGRRDIERFRVSITPAREPPSRSTVASWPSFATMRPALKSSI